MYGNQGENYTKVVDANINPFGAGSNPFLGLLEPSKEQQDSGYQELLTFWKPSKEQQNITRKDLLRFSNDINKMFVQRAKDQGAGLPLPDLMARCRYHSHAEKGQPCYLDK